METYRLAVCEDEKNVREEIQGLCDSILRDMRIKGDITALHRHRSWSGNWTADRSLIR